MSSPDRAVRAVDRAVRVVMPDTRGPLLVDGPVEVVLPDGTTLRSERPVVALCTCRRSRRYPFCDTSHRRGSAGSTTGHAPQTPREDET